MSLPFVNIVLQQDKADCAIAVLAMYLGLPYHDVFAAAITPTFPAPHKKGMYSRQIIQLAKRLNLKLTLKRTWDLETSCGLLTIEKIDKQPDEFAQHMVLLKFGLIFDTDGTVWEPADYFEQQKFRPVSIFVEEE